MNGVFCKNPDLKKENKPRACKICQASFLSSNALVHHHEKIHNSLYTRYKCIFDCGDNPYSSAPSLRKHYISKHSRVGVKRYIRQLYVVTSSFHFDYANSMCL